MKQWPKLKCLHFGYSPSSSSTAKDSHSPSSFQSQLRDAVALDKGTPCPCGAAAYRVADQAAIWFSSHAIRVGWLDFVFAFHDNEEIGPKMLARIAKHTGLKPEDL